MSWHLLDGPSRQHQRACWTVPEHLKENPQHGPGPFRRSRVPNPEALLQYVDTAIAITEYAQATRYLSPSNASPSSSSSSSPLVSSPIYPVRHSDDDLSLLPPLPSARKISRFKSASVLPQEYINSLLKHSSQEEATQALQQSSGTVAQENSMETGVLSSDVESSSEPEGILSGIDEPGKGGVYDARAADDAYRAACCVLSEGNAELALSLLHVASTKCPPDQPNALGKVRRLMGAALQLVEKNSAVLRSLPAEKDA
ncbi:hypothetical protein L7F22_068979 [Adiantum nelumboides]|nr:hypothetical protein [Adiantum nelumboides]